MAFSGKIVKEFIPSETNSRSSEARSSVFPRDA